jgi:hypothetical protein
MVMILFYQPCRLFEKLGITAYIDKSFVTLHDLLLGSVVSWYEISNVILLCVSMRLRFVVAWFSYMTAYGGK